MTNKIIAICCILALILVAIAAQPPNVLGIPNTVTTTNINTSSSGLATLVTHSGTLSIYVTHYHIFSAGTTNVSFVYGTQGSTACDTGTTTLDGPMAFIAQTGMVAGTGFGAVLAIPSGKDLCINNSQAIQVGGAVSWEYAQ